MKKKRKKNKIKSSQFYKFNPMKNIIEHVMDDYSNVSGNNIYSYNLKELKNCQRTLNLVKREHQKYRMGDNELFYVNLQKGIIKNVLDDFETKYGISINEPFVLVRSKEIANELSNYKYFFKKIKPYSYWRNAENNFFTNCLCSAYLVFEKDVILIKLKNVKAIYNYLRDKEISQFKNYIKLTNIMAYNSEHDSQKQRIKEEENMKKRKEFLTKNQELLNAIESRPAPKLDNVTVLIPAEKPRFSKKK